jgi:hypothetical protein
MKRHDGAPLPHSSTLLIPSKGPQAVRVVGDFSLKSHVGARPTIPVPPTAVKPAGDYVWRDPATGVITDPPAVPPPAVVAAVAQQEARSWFWFWVIMGLVFLTFFVVLILWPVGRDWDDGGGGGHHHHEGEGGWPGKSPSPSGAALGSGDRKEDCTNDELWNEEAKMCIMRSYFPQAVSPGIMDTGVSPCKDIYRHACGKWLDTHTNENRGFAGLSALNAVAVRNIVLNKSVANLNPFYQSCEMTLVLPPDGSKRRQRDMTLMDSKLTREAILGRMLDPLVSHADLPLVFARMSAAGYTMPVAFVVQGNPLDKGVIPMWLYDGFEGREHDEDWVRMHFEALYGEGSEQAAHEAKVLVDMVAKIDVHEPDRDRILDTYEGWKDYVTMGRAQKDMMSWSEFSSLSRSTFDWNIFLGELEKRLSLKPFGLAPNQQVWAFSRSYFEWFMPEDFTPSEWRTYITFSVLYHTHDFFPDLPADVLLSGRPINVVSPLRAAHRRLKKQVLSPSVYGYRAAKTRGKPNLWHKAGRRTSSRQPKHVRGQKDAEGAEAGLTVTSADCLAASKYMLPGILSREFLATRFKDSEQTRQRIQTMVERIRDRFVLNIERTPWLDNATRAAQASVFSPYA